ncbi:aromatic-ring-hydroxylating dioxygenase subunit beta [Croceicoccus sp. YJ47]|uniref:aromatic-ring-hydroxylating dioxygenase subunit beta n=1 Tax=Croceicoccus sp. YJ47 TaxID=2798724 RepID=UPI00192340D3|nr:aromatic-ring-hydroxylating dioxygenase subunit beta [Croceicoccus sp. YJ47]QQN75307.1 aromatic-ring-hydroxylating dioxygenase subunit beta [Croceicoccus sp. YJ47]
MTLTRAQAEDFLFHEAELLDDWLLEEWADLYTDKSVYEVASPSCEDPVNADPDNTLFLISDRIDRIRGRAKRLLKPTAHAEFPRSKTRHMVSNVRVVSSDDGTTRTRANFAVFRTKEDTSTVYMGEMHHTIVEDGGALRILSKRCILDLNSLYNQGRLTIIL